MPTEAPTPPLPEVSAERSTCDDFAAATAKLLELRDLLNGVVVGPPQLVEQLLTAIFSRGHVLIEGLPGLGKTHLAKGLAAALGLRWGRVQCTPDLLPADVTGADIYRAGEVSAFEFLPGPVFSELLLVDEINRATPRTQSALLEAMQERQVTHAGVTRRLPEPFCVIATQNPIELEGTYPLPEAQLDRFMMKIAVTYPDRSALRAMLDVSLDEEPADSLAPVAQPADVLRIARLCRSVIVGERCKAAAVDLVLATQPNAAAGEVAPDAIRYGASPRALQALIRAGRVRAVMAGRAHVDVEDLADLALPILRHRVLLRLESELHGLDVETLLAGLISTWRERL